VYYPLPLTLENDGNFMQDKIIELENERQIHIDKIAKVQV
jgi:hypothetical protein